MNTIRRVRCATGVVAGLAAIVALPSLPAAATRPYQAPES
jgi:hypothetical protein